MKKVIVDGSYLGKRTTGIQRFNREVVKELVKRGVEVTIAVPKDIKLSAGDIPDGAEVLVKGKKNNKFWQLFTLAKIAKSAKKSGAHLICMSNFSPLFKKDYLVLHDVTFLDKEGKNRRLWAFAHRVLIGWKIAKHKKIFTVSEFSKSRILAHYKKIKPENVVVVGSGGDHWLQVPTADFSAEFGVEPFWLSVGSTTENKNFGYVLDLARKNPAKRFIIVGRIDGDYGQKAADIPNVTLTGYLPAEKIKYLYSACECFILPSFYEGFGLPPLEALCCGCRRLALSDIEVFREIYGQAATFFDPYDRERLVDLDNIPKAEEEAAQAVMQKYNWGRAAEIIADNLAESN